jgi:hypothetical protein
MRNVGLFRYIGNIFLIFGYFLLLWNDPIIGLIIKCLGNFLIIPFAIRYKFWDILVLCAFYAAIEIPKLFNLIFPSLIVN